MTRDYLAGYLYFQEVLSKGRRAADNRHILILGGLSLPSKESLNQGKLPDVSDADCQATGTDPEEIRSAAARFLRWLGREQRMIDILADQGWEAACREVVVKKDDESGELWLRER